MKDTDSVWDDALLCYSDYNVWYVPGLQAVQERLETIGNIMKNRGVCYACIFQLDNILELIVVFLLVLSKALIPGYIMQFDAE